MVLIIVRALIYGFTLWTVYWHMLPSYIISVEH